jgi:hypothetical protein
MGFPHPERLSWRRGGARFLRRTVSGRNIPDNAQAYTTKIIPASKRARAPADGSPARLHHRQDPTFPEAPQEA